MTAGPVSGVLARATSVEDVRPSDARAGADYQRVTADGHDVYSRMERVIEWIGEIQNG